VRHFGGVFTFLVVKRQISMFDGHWSSLARAQRDFFKDFDVLAPKIPKIRWPAGALS